MISEPILYSKFPNSATPLASSLYINVMNAGKHNIIECNLNMHQHKTPIVVCFLSI